MQRCRTSFFSRVSQSLLGKRRLGAFPSSSAATRAFSTKHWPFPKASSPSIFLRPVLFTGSVCLGSFGAVAIWNAELESAETQRQGQNDTFLDKIKAVMRPKHQQRAKANEQEVEFRVFDELANEFRRYVPHQILYMIEELGRYLPRQILYMVEDVANDQTVGPIIVTSVALHALFCLPGMSFVKNRYFVHDPTSGRALPMLLSTFAHGGIFHLGINMAILWTFGSQLKDTLSYDGKLLAQNEQFWATYISAGTISSLGNICLGQAMQSLRRIPIHPGLGASGAICALVSSTFLLHPDMMVSIVPLPYMPASDVLKLMVIFDTLGLLHGGTGLGHGAHLAGYALGAFAVQMGGLHMIWSYQAWVDQMYETFKKEFPIPREK